MNKSIYLAEKKFKEVLLTWVEKNKDIIAGKLP